ncbi:ABC transporter ATP-binding protein [Nocardioides sp. SLBN-35]|uniref:ABC transporter ATP-binding protein n=1 Tax=Nocardioides sp. SLBN-35 TaxID=2768445 RepID=UPI00115274F2|nr:ABC transporter ATP-binding protein [Nocardioides sp. SLBN-35]
MSTSTTLTRTTSPSPTTGAPTMSERQVRLSIEGLHKGYGAGAARKEVISDLTFDVHAGEFVCIVGPSGAGKTTLLKCLTGLHPASSGAVRLDGQVVDGPPRQMALVLQEYTRSLMPWLTVEKNVRLPLANLKIGKAEREQRITDALREVGLSDVRTSYPWQLSGGMQQRVAIARALAYRPEVLVMDEPFASVDAQTRADLEDLMLKVREDFGITIVLVTHDIDEAVYLSDRVVVVTKGPCTVDEIIPVELPFPRDQIETKSDPRFVDLRARVFSRIKASA